MVEVFKNEKGEFAFRAKAPNGEIVGGGEGYTTKANCRKGIKALKAALRGRVKDLTK